MEIIRGIAAAGPNLIAVDIVTPDWPPDAEQQLNLSVPIVWVRKAQGQDDKGAVLEPVLGGSGQSICQGPAVIHEISGVAREYEQTVTLLDGSKVASFVNVIARVNAAGSREPCSTNKRPDDSGDSLPIPYLGKSNLFRHTSATTILSAMKEPEWDKRKLMLGKIVLLGGTFSDSRDEYRTPVQTRMYGVEILANIVAAEISNKTIEESGWFLLLVVDSLLGLALVAIGFFLRGFWALAITFLAVIILSIGSLAVFHVFRFYIGFMPVLVGLTIHFFLEQIHRVNHLVVDNLRLLDQNKQLTETVRSLEDDQQITWI